MSSENLITSIRGSFADAQSSLPHIHASPPDAASAAITIPLHDGTDAPALVQNAAQTLVNFSSTARCITGKAEQQEQTLSAASGGELSGVALHRGHEKYRLLTNQPQLTLEECIRWFLCSPRSKSIPNKHQRKILRRLRTKDGKRKMNEELLEIWNKLDNKQKKEYGKRAAEINAMLSRHKHASKRG